MDALRVPGKVGAVLAAVGFVVVVLVLALAFDLGPFKRAELTRGQLITRGDEICREAHQAFADLQRKAPQTAGQAAELTDQLIGIASDELDRIGSLNGSPEFDQEIELYLDARERGIDALRAGRAAAEEGDSSAYTQAQDELAESQGERHRIAEEIGFAICSRPLATG